MAYCLVADVESLMGCSFAETSRPSATEVGTAITAISADMDGVLRAASYTPLPVVDADALALLKQYATMATAARAWHTGYLSDEEPPRVTYWRAQYDQFLARIRNGTQVLPGSGASPSVSEVSLCDTLWRSDSLEDRY